MSTNNNGGAAFPQHGWSRDPEANKFMQDKGGMTLRDYFAARALQALVCGRNWDHLKGGADEMFATWSRSAYGVADAMLAAREERGVREQLVIALKDCLAVMEHELNGLAVIQPELRQARAALAAAGAA